MKAHMCKFESSQKEESRALSADSYEACNRPGAVDYYILITEKASTHFEINQPEIHRLFASHVKKVHVGIHDVNRTFIPTQRSQIFANKTSTCPQKHVSRHRFVQKETLNLMHTTKLVCST